MKNLFFSKRQEAIQSPFEVLWKGIIILACDLFKGVELTDEFVSEDGVIPPRYWRGVKIGHSVVNVSAFTDDAIHGAGGADDYVVVRCFVERKVLRQKMFHNTIVALESFLAMDRRDNLAYLWVGMRSMQAVFTAYPKILVVGQGGVQEPHELRKELARFMNPRFGVSGEPFMTEEQMRIARQNGPEFAVALLERLRHLEFDQEYYPVRFEGVSEAEFLDALRQRQLYELRLEGQSSNFAARRERSVFSVVQRKCFDLRYLDKESGEPIPGNFKESVLPSLADWPRPFSVVVQPSEIMVAVQPLPAKEQEFLSSVYGPKLEQESKILHLTPPDGSPSSATAPSAE